MIPRRIHAAGAALLMITVHSAAQAQEVLALGNTAGPSMQLEGYGASSVGGSQGPVYRVTTLADSGPGSLRDGVVNRTGPRTIVFDVAGTITMLSNLYIQKPYLTIDGSTAPSPGITLQIASLSIGGTVVICGTHDVIIRHLRFRGLWEAGGVHSNTGATLVIDGDSPPDRWARNIVLDHITGCNSTDGGPDIWGNVSDVTLSWSLIYYNWHPTSLSHYPAPYQPRRRISIHHNVYARNGERNPQIRADSGEIDFVNNVIFDWGYFGESSGQGTRIRNVSGEPKVSCNIVNNYYVPTIRATEALVYGIVSGPDSEDGGPASILPQGTVYTSSLLGSLWVAGNLLPAQNRDHYSTVAAPLPVPAAAQVTTYAPTDLKARLLPVVGMKDRWSIEQSILNDLAALMVGQTTLIGDFDGDGAVSASDMEALRACSTRDRVAASTACRFADLDGDQDVDESDFGLLQRCYAGPTAPVLDPACLK